MPSDSRSIVLHYDEENELIVCFSISAPEALALRKGEGFEIPLSQFRAVSADEAAERRKEKVSYTCSTVLPDRKTGIRNYTGEVEKDLEGMISELEATAAGGDAQAK